MDGWLDGWMGGQIDTDRHVLFIILLCSNIYNYFLNMTVIVTATGLFRCLLNMKQTAFFFPPKYVSQYTSEPEVTWEDVFLGKLSFL